MGTDPLDRVRTLTFDLFGTVLDLSGCLAPRLAGLLGGKSAGMDAEELWARWRARQRVEQYQDTILMLGHSGYLSACRRALLYTLKEHDVRFDDVEIDEVMQGYWELAPFPDAVPGSRPPGRTLPAGGAVQRRPPAAFAPGEGAYRRAIRLRDLRGGGGRVQAAPGGVQEPRPGCSNRSRTRS